MGKRRNGRRLRRRARLFEQQGGLCHWCACKMLLRNGIFQNGERQPLNLATIDHLRDRFHPGRTEPANGDQRWVAACWDCNNKRGRASVMAQPIEEIWRRSGHLDRMVCTA